MTQNFKGDTTELKMQAVMQPIFDEIGTYQSDFYKNGYDSNPFLLMLYDEKRMPFSDRMNRETFILFIKEGLKNFPSIGTFSSYLFILKAIFGELSQIYFEIPIPGKLTIDIDAISNTEFDFIGREGSDETYSEFNMIDYGGSILTFRGLSGIANEYQLKLLFAEIMPAGITPNILLSFYSRYDFISYVGSVNSEVITSNMDQIIFTEIGG